MKVNTAPLCDLNGDGYKEVVFSLVSGYSLFPRRFYAYDVRNDSLMMSQPTGIEFSNFFTIYPFHDKQPFFMCGSYASTNIDETVCKYHDQSSWWAVLDSKLNFAFPPVEFRGKHGGTMPFLITSSRQDEVGVLHSQPDQDSVRFFLYKYDINGKLLKQARIYNSGRNISASFFVLTHSQEYELLMQSVNGDILRFDSSFTFNGYMKGKFPNGVIYTFDADGDGEKEMICLAIAVTGFMLCAATLAIRS